MASIQQVEANRRNAQRSTGPRSDAGKQHSRDNALKHGMCSGRVVLPFEDPREYHLLHARIVSEQQPSTASPPPSLRTLAVPLMRGDCGASFWLDITAACPAVSRDSSAPSASNPRS